MIYYPLKKLSEVIGMKNKKQNSLTVFFTQFPKLVLAGVIFSAFFVAFMSLTILAGKFSGFDNILVWGLGIIPSAVFLPGLVMVVRKYSAEKAFVPVIPTFFKAVRENFRDFIFHGFVMYLIFASSFFAILYYFTQAQTDIVFAYILVIYILFTAIMILMLFYLPLMAVTYELRYRDLYKNSLLMIFGKIITNIITFIMVGVLAGASVLLLVFTDGALRILSIILITALLPMLVTYIVVSMISKGMQENMGSFVNKNPQPQNELSEEEKQTVKNTKTDDDYIFINGKMVKNPNKK